MMAWSNKPVEPNRRPASPFNAGRRYESVSCAQPLPSSAVAHLWRYAQSRLVRCLSQCLINRSPEIDEAPD